MPAASRAAPSGGLFLSQYDRALRFGRVSQFQRHAIGRIHLEEVIDTLPEQAALQPLPQHVSRKNVRYLLQKITGPRMPLHSHAQFAKPLDPFPDGRPRYADLPRDTRAADYDRGVLG